MKTILFKSLFLFILLMGIVKSAVIEKIEIDGNIRVNKETIKMFSGINIGEDLSNNDLNNVLKKLYDKIFLRMYN